MKIDAESTSFTSLEKLFKAVEGLTPLHRQWFENAFIGALSILCPKDAWEKALETARVSTIATQKERNQ